MYVPMLGLLVLLEEKRRKKVWEQNFSCNALLFKEKLAKYVEEPTQKSPKLYLEELEKT